MTGPDEVQVATSGKTVPRSDKCSVCGGPMLYWVPSEVAVRMFCKNQRCSEWLKEIHCDDAPR